MRNAYGQLVVSLLLSIISFGLVGCFSYQESQVNFSIQDPKPVKESKKLNAWIKIVSLPKFNHDTPEENVNVFFTYKLYKFIRESNQFEKVNILYSKDTKLPAKSIVLEFQFTRLEEKHKFHPFFLPLGIAGMGFSQWAIHSSSYGFFLSTILGGPDTENQIEYKGNLIGYDDTGQEIAKVPFTLQAEFNSNLIYYEKEIEANQKRKEMLELALHDLIKKGGIK